MSGFEFVYHALTLIENPYIFIIVQRSGHFKNSFDCLEKNIEKMIPNGLRNFFSLNNYPPTPE
jgi:hypothetical protein